MTIALCLRYTKKLVPTLLVSLLLPSAVAFANNVLLVDFGAQGQYIQSGSYAWSGVGQATAEFNAEKIRAFDSYVTASLSQGESSVVFAVDWQNYSQQRINHQLGAMIEDGVSRNGELGLTFESLPKGYYELTTYHHNAIAFNGVFDVMLNYGGARVQVADDVIASTGDQTEAITKVVKRFYTNGEPVVFSYKEDAYGDLVMDTRIVLNGFSLRRLAKY